MAIMTLGEKNAIPMAIKIAAGINEEAKRTVVSLIAKVMSIRRYVTIA